MQELREAMSLLMNIVTGGGCPSRELLGGHRPRERWSVMSYGRRRGLRPVSPYVIVLALAVVLTASFFLPTRAEAAFSDHTVPTISPSGTTINLFDYWVNSEDHLSVSGSDGINKGHRFQFKDQEASDDLNRYTGGSFTRPGIVNNVLTGGYPKLTNHWDGESLRYLFDSSTQTGKISHMGVTGLLQVNKDGYYEYDSSQNYAAYNANKNAFDVYNAAGVGQAGAGSQNGGQFFPFDAADKVFDEVNGNLVRNGITSSNKGDSNYNDGKPLNHYFGLSMSSRFVQPADGKTNAGVPMTFEFAGDDDVWVFIDDVLVGDIGGIHTSAKLTIDFQTGDIKVNDDPDGTLLSKFQDAGRGTSGFTDNTFANDTSHTLKFFYLERGATDSNMKLKYNLVTVPESDIIKFDQDGGLVEGAQFALYKTDERFTDTTTDQEYLLGSGTTDADGQLTLTNDDDNGVINFDDLYKLGCRYYLLKETKVPEGYRSSLTATDGSMQFEYVPTSDKNGAGGVIINHGGMDKDSVVWKNGTFAGAKETITAPTTVYQADDDSMKPGNTVDMTSGTLFAVVLKRDKSKNAWYAVSGDPTKGYTLAGAQGKEGAIEAAKKDLYAFTLNTSGQYQVEIPHLPGDISKYSYLLSGDARKDAEYTVAIYHTTASSIGDATPENTVHVYSDDIADGTNFKRQFATRLLVTNIQNRLFVQKTDTEGNPVDGAKFGLYKATTDANGKVVPKDDQGPYDTLTTGSVDNPVRLEGAGIFPCTSDSGRPLEKGIYFLKEVSAPKGFLLNDTLTKVIVDDYGVHADAGTADDGVSTFVGPGTLMKSLGQFGAEGDIDNTLTWIKGQRQTSDGTLDGNGNLSWNNDAKGGEDEVHLKYGANGRVYQYGPTKEGEPYRLETETGWIRMGITQDKPGVTNAKGARADLRDMNLNALFTGATCVRVANEREASLEVTKKVKVPVGLTGNKDAKFTFKFTVPEGQTYKAAVFEKAGTASERRVGNVFDLTNGYSQTIKADETIRVYGLAKGDNYTVKELTGKDEMPAGYKLTGRKQGDKNLTEEGDSISGTIASQDSNGTLAEDNKLVFTNSYSVKSSVTLTGIRAQKVLQGRKWTKADSFDIYLRAAKGTPMPEGYKNVSGVNGYVQVVKTVNNDDEFDFGKITYEKPGTYTYTVAERTPDEHDSSWLPGFGYSSAGYTVTVQVDDTGKGTLSEPVVTMARNDDDDGTHHDPAVPVDNKVAVFTNKFSTDTKTISFNAQKSYTDESGDNPLAAGKFTFELKALGGLANSAVGAAPIKFNDLSYTVNANDAPMPAGGVTTAKNDGGGIAAFPQITFTAADQNTTYVYQVTERANSDASTTGGMTYDTTVYYAMVQNTLDDKGQLSSTATYWKADGTQLTDTGGYIPFKNTYTVAQTTSAPVNVQKTLAGRAWEQDDKFDFTLTPADDATTKAVKNEAVTQKKAADSDETGDLTTKVEIAGPGDAMRTTPFGAGDLVFTKPGVYTFKVNETRPTDADKTGISYDGHTSTVTYTVTDIENGTHTGKLTASVAYDNEQATTDADRQVTGAAAFTNTYTASGTYAGIDVTKTLVGTPLENGMFPFTIKAMTYNGTKAPEPVDSDKSFKNTVGKDDGDDTQTATMSGKLKMNFTQLSYNKMYVYKVSEVHDANADGYTYDTEYPGDAYVLIAVKPNLYNEGQLDTETTVVKGPNVTALVGEDGDVNKLTAEAIKGLDTTTNYVQTVSSCGVKPATPIVPFKNTYQPAGTSVALTAKKAYVKSDSTPAALKDGEFTFGLYKGDLTADQLQSKQPIQTATNAADGAVTFPAIDYTKAGKYKYTIAEQKGSLSHVTYDATVHHAVVTIVDNAGKLEANVTYDDGKTDDPTFKNTYGATGSAELTATKTIKVADGFDHATAPADGEFTFDLKDAAGNVLDTAKNDANGKVSFTRKFTLSDLGGAASKDFTYTIVEQPGAEPGMVYDNHPLTYKVTVADDGTGTLTATPRVTSGDNSQTFTNTYRPKETSVTLKATKRFTGGELAGNDFTFQLLDGGGSVVQTVQNDKDGKVTFQAISYDTPGDHDYTIKEVKGADPTVVYDAKEVKVHVKVTDEKGELKAVATYGGDKAVPTFTNAKPTAGATIEAKKTLTGKDLTEGAFAFGLYNQDGNEVAKGTNDRGGKVKLAVKNLNLGEYDYTLKEEKAGQTVDGVVYDAKKVKVHVKVEQSRGDNNKTKVTVTYDGAATAPTFNNTYDAKGSATLSATKTIKVADGFDHATAPADGEFTFDLKDAAGNVLDTAKNDANGKVSFTREFQLADLGGATSKDFTYTIVEQKGAEAGMVYDNHPLTYKVTVTDGGNGALNAKAIVTSTSGSETFTNTYQPAATGLALGAQKSYAKKDDNTPIVLKGGEFTFDVYEGNLTAEQLKGKQPVRTATNDANGSVGFDAFSYAKPGTHEYTIVERKGDLAYVTYDAAVHHAVVTVADNAGTLQASVAYDGTDATKPTFTNTYEARATDSGAIALTKSVNVHDGSYQLKAGDFAFELMGSDGSVIQTQKNDADGKVAFDKLTFDHAGTFIYTVREVQPTDDAPGVPGVTYTGKTYTLTYVVKDNNDGKLVVKNSTVKPSEGTEDGVSPGTMAFANSYQPRQTSYQISGTKVLKNADPATTRTPADGEFTFALIDVATGQEIDRTTNVGNAFTFKAISYTATGSHAYQVKEVAGHDGTITYSDAVLDVKVSVTDDGSGQLTATANKTAADLTFTNTYTPTATTATITGTKALTGRNLAEGEFSFDLKDADGNVVQTVQNGADGTFGFAPLQLDKVGTYVYTLSERAGATANGVTYDTTVFTATVTVTENAETHALETQVAYSKGGKAADAVAFSNSYAPAATEVKLGASKVLSGEDLKEGQFSFQLKDTDGKVLQTVKNAADGTVGFEAISYDKPGTYTYSISEVDDGQKNVTYDATEHQVTVTVTDDGAGHLVATVAYGGDVAPVFKNTYTPPTTPPVNPPVNPPTNPPSKSPVPKKEKPGLPEMGDTSLSPMALGGIAGGAVVLIAAGVILRRRNR